MQSLQAQSQKVETRSRALFYHRHSLSVPACLVWRRALRKDHRVGITGVATAPVEAEDKE